MTRPKLDEYLHRGMEAFANLNAAHLHKAFSYTYTLPANPEKAYFQASRQLSDGGVHTLTYFPQSMLTLLELGLNELPRTSLPEGFTAAALREKAFKASTVAMTTVAGDIQNYELVESAVAKMLPKTKAIQAPQPAPTRPVAETPSRPTKGDGGKLRSVRIGPNGHPRQG